VKIRQVGSEFFHVGRHDRWPDRHEEVNSHFTQFFAKASKFKLKVQNLKLILSHVSLVVRI